MTGFKNNFFLLIFLFFLTSYNPINLENNKSFFFPIKKILINETKLADKNVISSKLIFLENKSLFFLQKKWIKDLIKEFNFISNLSIKKIYPDTIKIKIIEKKAVAIQILKNEKFYITEEGEKIEFIPSNFYKELPIIYGNQKNFTKFLKDLKDIEFNTNTIRAFYYFDIGRWDIKLKDDKVIKLPEENFIQSLKNFMELSETEELIKYNNFDYRMKDQLILK